MAIRYIRVRAVTDIFTPVERATGNLAIIGAATAGAVNTPIEVGAPSEAATTFGANTDLADSIALAYRQTPGPPLVMGIRLNAQDFDAALTAAEGADVQFVVVAKTALDAQTGGATGAINRLASHVDTVSNQGADGKERMGVAMLAKDSTSTGLVTGTLATSRMVYVAHRSDQDAAAAVAGMMAGHAPPTSMLLKKVSLDMPNQFTDAEIQTINGQEPNVDSPPAGQGVNWLVDPRLIPGRGLYLGEGYTGDPGGGRKFIDIVRTIDDVTFKLKARLIASIGAVRITRAGLRGLAVQVEAILDPLVQDGTLAEFQVIIPVLALLDKDPASLTPAQLKKIKDARDNRIVEIIVTVKYAGAVHRIAINLKFE